MMLFVPAFKNQFNFIEKLASRTILIFADANRRAAIASVRILSEQGFSLLFAIHQDFPERFTNMIFKRYTKFPLLKYSSSDFLSFLNEVQDLYGDYSILPIGEWQIRQILENRDKLNTGIHFCIEDIKGYQRLSNKRSFIALCDESEIKVPKEIDNLPSCFSFRFVIKPKSYDGDDNVLKYPLLIDNEKAFNEASKLKLDFSKHFIQEYIFGPSVYYCAFYRHGELINCFSQLNTVQQPNGKSVLKAEPFTLSPEVSQRINHLFRKLNWNGPIMFELKRCDASGQFYAIECNPRLWGPLQITIDNGVDFVSPCFEKYPKINTVSNRYGYIWLSGYVAGYLMKVRTKQNFQIFKSYSKTNYRELFWRRNTRKYFIFDMLFQCKELVKYHFSSSDK